MINRQTVFDTRASGWTIPHAEFGFEGFQLVTGFLGNLPQQHVLRTLELFAKDVRPRLQHGTSRVS
jgi:hypothetical protein